MAITKVVAPLSAPISIADWEAMHAHMTAFITAMGNQQFILTNMTNLSLPQIAQGSFIQFGGSLYVVDTENYSIIGTPSDGVNYIRISGDTTLTAEWVDSDSGYAWNYNYNQMVSGSYGLLPYIVIKDGSDYHKKNVFPNINKVSNVYTVESTGNFTVPKYSRLFAFCIGGGGAGGGGFTRGEAEGSTGYYGGSGGGSGYTEFTELFVEPDEILSITIGAGGVYGDTASSGGVTLIETSSGVTLLSANGGSGGGGEYSGGARGSYRTYDNSLVPPGDGIGTDKERKNARCVGGYTIDYSLGGGGGGGVPNSTTGGSGSSGGGNGGDYTQAGQNATTYGSGGGGGGAPSTKINANNGGNGKDGVVIFVVV